jgi:phosphate transport system substrate-binding protein
LFINKGLACHLTVIQPSYNDDMGRVGIPLAGWIVDRTGPAGGARSAPITNRNKSPRFVAVGKALALARLWLVQQERGMRLLHTLAATTVLAAASLTQAVAADISGAGATFPYPIFAKWADTYKKETGIGLNYQSIGSGGGIRQIQNKTVTFGASDMPLKPEELNKFGLTQFPAIIGGDVPVVNLEGVKPGDLKLEGPTLARIFLGEIKTWNDAAIQKLNPNVKLPSQPIVVVHRSDGSGTTYIWTDYLSKVSPTWKSKVGANTSVEWPVGIGAKGNEGVANNVANTKGSIGYVEYAYAKQNKLTTVSVSNKDGKVVEANIASFQAAAANADWEKSDGFYVVLTDQPGAASWPIAGTSFILIYKKPQDPAASREALKFFAWAYAKGGKMAEELDYVPMPEKVVGAIQKSWQEIKDEKGQPVFAAK